MGCAASSASRVAPTPKPTVNSGAHAQRIPSQAFADPADLSPCASVPRADSHEVSASANHADRVLTGVAQALTIAPAGKPSDTARSSVSAAGDAVGFSAGTTSSVSAAGAATVDPAAAGVGGSTSDGSEERGKRGEPRHDGNDSSGDGDVQSPPVSDDDDPTRSSQSEGVPRDVARQPTSPDSHRRSTVPSASKRLPPVSSPGAPRRTPTRLNPIRSTPSMGDLRPGGSFLRRPLPHLGKNLHEAHGSLTRQEVDALLARRNVLCSAALSPPTPGESPTKGSPLMPLTGLARRHRGMATSTIPLSSPDMDGSPSPGTRARSAAARTALRKRSLLATTPPISASGRGAAAGVTRDLTSFLQANGATVSGEAGGVGSPPQPVATAVSAGTHAAPARNFLNYENNPSLRMNEIEDLAARKHQQQPKQRRRSKLGQHVLTAEQLEQARAEAGGDATEVAAAVSAGTHAAPARNFLNYENNPSLRMNEIEDLAARKHQQQPKQRRRSKLGQHVLTAEQLEQARAEAGGDVTEVAAAVSAGTHAAPARNFLNYENNPSLRMNEIEDLAARKHQQQPKQRRRSKLGQHVLTAEQLEQARAEAAGDAREP